MVLQGKFSVPAFANRTNEVAENKYHCADHSTMYFGFLFKPQVNRKCYKKKLITAATFCYLINKNKCHSIRELANLRCELSHKWKDDSLSVMITCISIFYIF